MTKKPRLQSWGKNNLFNKWCWGNYYLIPYRKINSKLIEDLNIQPVTVKLREENIGDKLLDIGLSNDYL